MSRSFCFAPSELTDFFAGFWRETPLSVFVNRNCTHFPRLFSTRGRSSVRSGPSTLKFKTSSIIFNMYVVGFVRFVVQFFIVTVTPRWSTSAMKDTRPAQPMLAWSRYFLFSSLLFIFSYFAPVVHALSKPNVIVIGAGLCFVASCVVFFQMFDILFSTRLSGMAGLKAARDLVDNGCTVTILVRTRFLFPVRIMSWNSHLCCAGSKKSHRWSHFHRSLSRLPR
jgi:hypothetical protein